MSSLHHSFVPGLMSQDAAAYYLDVSVRTLNELQAQGRIIPKRIGSKRGFARADLDAFIEALPDWEPARKTTAA